MERPVLYRDRTEKYRVYLWFNELRRKDNKCECVWWGLVTGSGGGQTRQDFWRLSALETHLN